MVETDASDYALAAILSIIINDELHQIAFLSRTFTSTELNYDVHDKELLAIFEAFKKSTTKILTRRQARWSEFLSQFNMVIRFCPGCLRAKPTL